MKQAGMEVDEVVGSLIAEGKIRSCIVVAVSNIPETRYGDFLPQKILEYLPEGTDISKEIKYNADNYLRLLVEEVKPLWIKTIQPISPMIILL